MPPHLVKNHLTLFLKSYRRRLRHKIRYYAIGEYGDKYWRPHFHLAVFSEKQLERCVRPCEDMRKRDQCTQDCIPRLAWKKGNISVTPKLTESLAGYITGYIKRKATKEREINRPNEYSTQSTGNGNGERGIGYRAIKEIANKYNDNPTTRRQIISSLSFGGRSRPLGGYLSKCFADHLGISERELNDQFIEYAYETYGEHVKDGMMIPEILRKSEGKRNSQVVKQTKFKRKRNYET